MAAHLARQLARTRHATGYEIGAPRRLGPGQVDFGYYARPRRDFFCRALIEVAAAGRTDRARFTHQRCAAIPADALAFERATRRAVAAARGKARAVARAGERALAAIGCLDRVPRRTGDAAQAIFAVSVVEAIERPVDPLLGVFVTALASAPTRDSALIAGRSALADELATLRGLPRFRNACAALSAWRRRGFRRPAPFDEARVQRLLDRLGADQTAIERGARALLRDGIFPRTASAFSSVPFTTRRRSRWVVAAG